MTNIRICRIPFLTGWRCAWLPQPPPVWPTDSDRSSRKIVTVVQNRKLVTWPEYVLWSSDEPKVTEAFFPSCWNQMIGDITLARLRQWPSDQTCRLDQNIFFDRLTNGQCLKLSQPENWSCDMSLSRYRPYLCFHERCSSNDKWQIANDGWNCFTNNLGR